MLYINYHQCLSDLQLFNKSLMLMLPTACVRLAVRSLLAASHQSLPKSCRVFQEAGSPLLQLAGRCTLYCLCFVTQRVTG